MLYKEGMIGPGQTLRNFWQVFIKASAQTGQPTLNSTHILSRLVRSRAKKYSHLQDVVWEVRRDSIVRDPTVVKREALFIAVNKVLAKNKKSLSLLNVKHSLSP